ncbi:MAG: hypothetical protein RJB58_1148 [Pseudomonadota bacterium]
MIGVNIEMPPGADKLEPARTISIGQDMLDFTDGI